MVMMGWGGASGLSPVVYVFVLSLSFDSGRLHLVRHVYYHANAFLPNSGIFFFVGPVLLVLTTIFEWIMGNFFSMVSEIRILQSDPIKSALRTRMENASKA